MSEPEIARRCSSCGASLRERAFFCPQCGKELRPTADPTAASKDTEAELRGFQKPELTSDASELVTDKESDSERAANARTVAVFPGSPRKSSVQGSRHVVHNVNAGPRDVMDDVHGVERLRQISSAVLDEASYDPSLRFVLVAVVLFILFLLLLILSELIT